jgi:4-amino-4-deoxy-L-arabinose transferase-like glycosyltransferase
MFASLYDKLKLGWKKIHLQQHEWFTLAGSLVTLLVFSFSKFQLPYYSNIIFPLLAILTAAFIFKIHEPAKATWRIIYDIITFILVMGGIALAVTYQPPITGAGVIILVLIGALFILFVLLSAYLRTTRNRLGFLRTCLVALALNLFLNGIFYPDLLKYQSGSEAAKYINKVHPGSAAVITGLYSPVYEFYADEWVKVDTAMTNIPERARQGIWLMAPQELRYLEKAGLNWEVVKEINEFHVTMLNLKFLNYRTREEALNKYYLIRVLN